MSGGTAPTLSQTQLYSYNIAASGGYDPGGNISTMTDSVMGNWNYGYDTLNRLITGESETGPYAGYSWCWSYDSFGNRTAESYQTTACPSPETSVTATATATAGYYANNQVQWTTVNSAANGFRYDVAGNVIDDAANQYFYDAEGRLCGVKSGSMMTGYFYDAEGGRVAKGTLSSWPQAGAECPGLGQAALTNRYVLGQSGEQMAELNGTGNWLHSNVYAGGALLATYGDTNVYFALKDWLGTKRAEYAANGLQSTFSSLPYGNRLTADGALPDATEHHFTGEEHDNESGNDYFGARYYASSMGRFMSPDPSGMAFTSLSNPQSFNMYSYVQNNPLNAVDPDGLDCVYIDNDSGQMTGFNRGDCDNSTDAKANSGYYFDGTVNTIYTTTGDTSGQVVGVQGMSDATGGDLFQANPAGLSFAQPNGSTSTNGMDTTIDTWGNYSQTTQFNHGSHPFRDNNPGDITAGPFTSRNGQLGTDGRFAVFPGAGTGRQALHTLLTGGAYFNLSINAAVAKYAPSMENNTAGYQQFLTNVLGVSGNTPLSSLSPGQFQKLEGAIASEEGFNARGNYSISVTTNF